MELFKGAPVPQTNNHRLRLDLLLHGQLKSERAHACSVRNVRVCVYEVQKG